MTPDVQSAIRDNLSLARDRIVAAARRSGRDPSSIRLVSVGKTHPAQVLQMAVDAGARIIGENYIQEARAKFDALIHCPAAWHFIGHLQRNKAKYAVRIFDLIHTVDSLKLASELDRQAGNAGKVQELLVQVNISGEATKSGVSPENAQRLLEALGRLEHVHVRGLMTMPPFFNQPEMARPYFAALRKLRDRLEARDIPGIELHELSMGMSGDFEVAIEEGATLVRIGTLIFGGRS